MQQMLDDRGSQCFRKPTPGPPSFIQSNQDLTPSAHRVCEIESDDQVSPSFKENTLNSHTPVKIFCSAWGPKGAIERYKGTLGCQGFQIPRGLRWVSAFLGN